MHKKIFTIALICFVLLQILPAQGNFHLQIGMNMGASQLFHNTRFKETPMLAYYETIEEVKKRDGDTYSWEEFEDDFGIQNSYIQPRFGFSALLTYRDWPVFIIAEAMSSPSSYTKMAYGAMAGLGKDFPLVDESWFISFYGGYKYVIDQGFGTSTLANSIRDDFMRERVPTFFNPVQPLGRQRANLFAVRTGLGKDLGEVHKMRVGIEFFGELDLVDKSVRASRMTNVGAQAYLRFKMF